MLFNERAFTVTLRKRISEGNRAALESFLTSELNRIENSDFFTGGGCLCGRTQSELEEEDLGWQRNRVRGLIMIRSELANYYREEGGWTRCFAVYDKLYANLDEAGLTGTEFHARVLLNEAYARMDQGERDCAFDRAQYAEEVLRRAGSKACNVWAMLHNLLAVIYCQNGDGDRAAEASREAASMLKKKGAGMDPGHAESKLNHATALLRLGNVDESLTLIDEVIASRARRGGHVMTRLSALNLKAMILYGMKDYGGSGEAFEKLILAAQEHDALSSRLPSVCENCSKMFALAGCEEKAQRYRILAKTL